MDKPLIYLASPYSRNDLYGAAKRSAETRRFRLVAKTAAFFMDQGHHIFCPISHTHPLWEHGLQDKNGDWWLEQDLAILRHCQQLWVCRMQGWKESYGVGKEMQFAIDHNIPIMYIDPVEEE